jgi:putative membrane protein
MLFNWLKAFHIIALISWMAGLLYLPRLYVYHVDATAGSELSQTLKIMERKLLRLIINPAMVATFVFGIWMLLIEPEILQHPYMHIKLGCVVLMTGVHGMLARYRRVFDQDCNVHTARFFRVLNEIPAVLMIIIVIMIVVRPGG